MRQQGFSITEILIVLLIVAILALALMPAYHHHILTAHRSDAIKTIAWIQAAEEKHRTNNTTYGTLTDIGQSSTSQEGHYTITVSDNTATTYTITATAIAAQANDTRCVTFTLAYANGATTKTSSPSSTCWN